MNNNENVNYKQLFNMNSILNSIIAFGAYIVLILSVAILIYLSFVKRFIVEIDWTTLGIFSGATVFLSCFCWSVFYRKQYEKVMSDDIAQQEENKYSVHSRYYMAIKDWKDTDLQLAIDKFNDEYIAKWLRYVEKVTGCPIETRKEVLIDEITGEQVLDENGKPIIVTKTGIKDLPYKGFKHKVLMWRIKKHKYPRSGYNTSMELMSLFSFQEANLNKRHLRADKNYFRANAIGKLLTMLLIVTIGASLIPEMIEGNTTSAILKLIIAVGSLLSATFTGSLNGVKGARMKLSTVEDVCADLERWADKKPILSPYKEPTVAFSTNESAENDNIDINSIFLKLKSEKS